MRGVWVGMDLQLGKEKRRIKGQMWQWAEWKERERGKKAERKEQEEIISWDMEESKKMNFQKANKESS